MKKRSLLTVSVAALTVLGTVSCGGEKANQGLVDAADYIWQMYKNESSTIKTATTADYNLVTKVKIDETEYNVSWAVTLDSSAIADSVKLGEVVNNLQTIDVTYDPILSTKESYYTLTATITDANGDSEVKSFERFVPAFEFSTFKEISNFKKGQVYNVKGVITSKSSSLSNGAVKNLWLQNDDFGILAYNLVCDSEDKFNTDLAIGNEIIVSGTVTRYNGQLEFEKNCSYQVVSTTTQTPKFIDATKAFADAKDAKDTKALDIYQNRLVELKGVTIGTINESSFYYYFKIGNSETYLRTSTSYGMTEAECKETVSEWTQGYIANIKGLCVVYSGLFYIQPIDTDAVTITERVLTDEVKVNNAVTDVKNLIPSEIVLNTSINLPTNPSNEEYNTVSYAWSVVEGNSSFAITDGKLNVTIGDQAVTGKIKVVASLNNEKAEYTFEVVAKQPELVSISKFLTDKNEDDLQYIKGVVVASAANKGKTGSFVIADQTGSIFSYNKFNVNVGDEVIIGTKYSSFNGFHQSNTELVSVISTGNDIASYLANPTVITATDLYTALQGLENDTAIVDTYCGKPMTVTGLIKKTDNGCAMFVSDTAKNYVVNVYANDTLSKALEAYYNTEVTITGFLRGVSSKFDSITLQVTQIED